jgi:hypothetical protein
MPHDVKPYIGWIDFKVFSTQGQDYELIITWPNSPCFKECKTSTYIGIFLRPLSDHIKPPKKIRFQLKMSRLFKGAFTPHVKSVLSK